MNNIYNFSDFIIKTINDLKIQKFTDIQTKTIPLLLKNENLIVQSHTGTGKTLSFILPILEKINFSENNLQAIIFVPTNELAIQIFNVLKFFKNNNNNMRLKNFTKMNLNNNKDFKNKNTKIFPHIIITTPYKFKIIFDLGLIKITNLKNIVLDEMDMIYELGFFNEIKYFISKLKNIDDISISSFSATISQNVKIFFEKEINNIKYINLQDDKKDITNKNIEHILIPTKHKEIKKVLKTLLNSFNPYLCFIFVNKKKDINEIYETLKKWNFNVCKIHGDLTLRERKQILKNINNLKYKYVICSDIMSRGLDVDGVSHIISLDLPHDLNYYIHRSGRTGRYKYKGYSYVLFDNRNLNKIEYLIKMGINFKKLNWTNDHFSEKIDKYKNKNEKVNKNKNFNFKIKQIESKYKKIKPNYKNKKNQKIKKIIKNNKK